MTPLRHASERHTICDDRFLQHLSDVLRAEPIYVCAVPTGVMPRLEIREGEAVLSVVPLIAGEERDQGNSELEGIYEALAASACSNDCAGSGGSGICPRSEQVPGTVGEGPSHAEGKSEAGAAAAGGAFACSAGHASYAEGRAEAGAVAAGGAVCSAGHASHAGCEDLGADAVEGHTSLC